MNKYIDDVNMSSRNVYLEHGARRKKQQQHIHTTIHTVNSEERVCHTYFKLFIWSLFIQVISFFFAPSWS